MKIFLSSNYWLNIRPGSLDQGAQIALLVFVLALMVLFLICRIIKKQKKKSLYNRIWRKLSNFSLGNFFIGVFLLFFAYETVPFLSMRLWFLLWVVGILVWLYFISRELVKIPHIKEEIAKEQEFNKYIP